MMPWFYVIHQWFWYSPMCSSLEIQFKPIHTDEELQMMNHVEWEFALKFDKKHKKPRMAMEYSFHKQVIKFWYSDDYCRHKITQSGLSNWYYLRSLWNLQTLFFNLYIVLQVVR